MKQQEPNMSSADLHGVNATDSWEAAYVRFETPEEEIQKFLKRLRLLGATSLPRDTRVVELFCGRGNGLHALSQLGFTNLEGVDLSARLVGLYQGPAKCYVSDCRQLPFPDRSRDVLIVQGGLHHLPTLPDDLEQTLAEMHRVVRRRGRVIIVEPWQTPFLRLAHSISEIALARHYSAKLDAFATMIELERATYERWLSQPRLVLDLLRKYFKPVHESFAWGKFSFVGTPL
ncbi:MAG: class I SAM-dependent methyltransferase [Candidatus Acidiferrales bacterium]